jgi:ATP-dependent Clp protease, protease subunit
MNRNPNYFRIVTEEREDSADMYLYGYIGQDFWWDEQMKEESLTDLEVVKSIKDLEKKYSRINVRINSPGGSVFHGDPIITALRSSTAEIHTYIDGIAGSMAADIWVIGKVRHMASNSKLMIHSTSSFCWGTAKDMTETAKMLESFDSAAISTFSEATGMAEDEVKERFYDYRDHWVTAPEAKEMGLIDEIDTYDTVETVANPEKMSYSELLKQTAKAPKEKKVIDCIDDIELETEIFILNNEQ